MLSRTFSRDRCALCRALPRHHRNNTVRVTLITRAADHPYHPPGLRDNNDNGTVAIPKSTPHTRALGPIRNTQAVTALANTGMRNGTGKRRANIMANSWPVPKSGAIMHLAVIHLNFKTRMFGCQDENRGLLAAWLCVVVCQCWWVGTDSETGPPRLKDEPRNVEDEDSAGLSFGAAAVSRAGCAG